MGDDWSLLKMIMCKKIGFLKTEIFQSLSFWEI